MREIREIIRFWESRRGQPLALATLVAVRGSSFRLPGARMLISVAGESAGGLSAGCIEEEVIACACEVLRSGMPQSMTFDTRLRFGCHGAIDIFVEPLREELLAQLREVLGQRETCRLETIVHGEEHGTRLIALEPAADAFVQTIEPNLRLLLLGDGPEIAAMRAHAALLGWDVMQMESALGAPGLLDERTAVVIATHHFGRDCASLHEFLPLGLKYLGLVGSRRRRDDILFDVMHRDLPMHSALFAPAGLHLGAESPEEIALSIIAEIQCVFGGGTGEPLRHRKAPIHQPVPQTAPCMATPV